ncbi:MAG TPA: HAD-IA family hydrolase [Conexivisphaerales archaeon]|nr:HAD-IA family hydrolase [Conexivisphaerales archaeon]
MKDRGIDAALFDWSGTLSDDLDVVWRSNDETLMSFGVPHQDLESFKEKFILPWQSFYSLYGLGTPELLSEVDRRFWKIYRPISEEIEPFPETLPTLRRIKGAGIKVAIVTQTKRGPLLEQIRRFGLDDLVDVAVGAEDASELKPSPKPILAALEKLGVKPERAVFTGDMVEDALSGNRAGVKVISIVRRGSYQTEERVRAGGPFRVAHSMEEAADLILSL